VPGRINYFLREYQRDGVRFLWDRFSRREGAILADDMGNMSALYISPLEDL
jgi:SNF2 family DNA or RNA helicase